MKFIPLHTPDVVRDCICYAVLDEISKTKGLSLDEIYRRVTQRQKETLYQVSKWFHSDDEYLSVDIDIAHHF